MHDNNYKIIDENHVTVSTFLLEFSRWLTLYCGQQHFFRFICHCLSADENFPKWAWLGSRDPLWNFRTPVCLGTLVARHFIFNTHISPNVWK